MVKKVYERIFVIFQWLPESARFHATSGDSEKALSTLQKIAEENGKFQVFRILYRTLFEYCMELSQLSYLTHHHFLIYI